MELNFFENAIKGSLVWALILSIFLYFNVEQPGASSGILMGALWSCLNIFFFKILLQNILTERKNRSSAKIFTALLIKFPCLYFLGYSLMTLFDLPAIYCLIGFSLIFAKLLLDSIKVSFSPTSANLFPIALLLILPGILHASARSEFPELPNIFSFLFHGEEPQTAWQEFVQDWENIIFSLFAAIAISILFCIGAKHKADVPSGLQNFLEFIVETLQKAVYNLLGPEGEKYIPLLGTLFIYILVMNWMVLIPFLKAPSSSLNVTAALAICVFFLVQYLSFKNFGWKGYLYHMAGSPVGFVGWAMVPLMLPIELITQLTRPLTLAFRLFGNVVGEDVLIGVFALFGASLFASSQLPIVLPLQLPFMLFALFTGFIQALVFTLLTAIYILLSMPEGEERAPE